MAFLFLQEIANWINHNQFLNPTSILLSVLSIGLTIYFYIRGQRRKKPKFAVRSTNIISDTLQSIGDVKVFYKEDEITNLTVTKIALWNGGNETMNYTDLANTDYLRISSTEGVVIFNAEVIFQSDQTTNLSILLNEKDVFVIFDYFDFNQGGIIKIIHSGKKSSSIQVKGTFRGAGVLKQINVSNPAIFFRFPGIEHRLRLPFKAFLVITFLTSCGFIIASQFVEKSADKTPLLIIGSLYGLLSLLALVFTESVPKGFKAFYGDD